MRIRVEQLNPTVGDISGNKRKILDALQRAEQDDMDLLIVPELGLCGYPPMDLLERRSFLEHVFGAADDIIKQTGSTALIFGSPMPNPSETGRKVFNAAIVARNGQKIDEAHKTLLPTYDVFDEHRYFEPNERFECVELDGIKFGVTICEDIWYNENAIQYHIYEQNPIEELVDRGAEMIVNISASPFTKHKPEHRREMLQQHAREYSVPIFYANQVGGNTELIFDGDSMIIDADAHVVRRSPLFVEHAIDVTWNRETGSFEDTNSVQLKVPGKEERIFKGLCLGLKDYLDKSEISDKVILGLSGGIDSTLVATIAAEALGPEQVIGVTMPSEFSSAGSVGDSEKLANNLGITLHELPIRTLYDDFLDILDPVFGDAPFNVAEENIQSRARGVLLMAISNKFGYMLVNTGNKSEMAVGYCTLYGDMAGGLSILSDVYKTEVFAIARWLNDEYYQKEMIPNTIIEKPPSAELRPDQKDSDSLPDYALMDGVLEQYIECQKPREQIIEQGFDPKIVDQIIRMVDFNEFKRRQAPPGLKVSEKAFGVGRRLPIVQQWTGHESKTAAEQ